MFTLRWSPASTGGVQPGPRRRSYGCCASMLLQKWAVGGCRGAPAAGAAQLWTVRPLCEPLPLPPGRWRVRALLALDAQAAGAAGGLLGWLSPDRESGAAAEPAGGSRLSQGQAGAEGGDVLAVWRVQAQGGDARAPAPPGGESNQQHSALCGWQAAAALLGGAALACLASAPGAGFDALAGASTRCVDYSGIGVPALCGLMSKGIGLRPHQAAAQILVLLALSDAC